MSTEWRDDESNLAIVRELNRAYDRLPFSREYEGVLDHCPFRITWTLGANLPVAWKGGVTGVFGDEIAMVGGLWMPGRKNLAYAYNLKKQTYTEMPPPPFPTAYTQGAYDGQNLYLIGGRAAGRNVARLNRDAKGQWEWTALPSLPESDEQGRWVAAAGVVSDRWLLLVGGHPTGTPSETAGQRTMPDWRLRLDQPGAIWEPMTPYPGGKRNVMVSGVVQRRLYVFGGSKSDEVIRSIATDLSQKYGIRVPHGGVPQYRDAYCYDPDADRWHAIRNLPFPTCGSPAVTLEDRYILLLGGGDVKTFRVGKAMRSADPFWWWYGDRILCYDVEADNYSRVGVMPYGVATCPWVYDGEKVYGFGGEPGHGYNENTENVTQIGTIHRVD